MTILLFYYFFVQSEWVQVSSPKVGWFWLNKNTGETRRDIGITEER